MRHAVAILQQHPRKNRLTHKKKQAINKRDTARFYSKTRPVTGVLKQPLRQKQQGQPPYEKSEKNKRHHILLTLWRTQ
jgi:hypothetical protein|tara:strand:- start:6815 stop:7048 length:234 start_codon:yes stop_codon:yes gene_type:complete